MKNLLVILSSLVAVSAMADGDFSKLDKKHPVRAIVDAIDLRWADANISSGATSMYAQQYNGDPSKLYKISDWVGLTEKELRDEYSRRSEVDMPENAHLTNYVKQFSAADMDEIYEYIADSNAFSPKNVEAKKSYVGSLWVVLNKLGVKKNKISYVRVTAKYTEKDKSRREITQILLMNKETGVSVWLYLSKGDM